MVDGEYVAAVYAAMTSDGHKFYMACCRITSCGCFRGTATARLSWPCGRRWRSASSLHLYHIQLLLPQQLKALQLFICSTTNVDIL